MCKYRSSAFLRLVMLPLTLVSFLSACHKWVPVHATIEDAVAATRLESVRITMSDGRILDLKNATVEGDSVIGFAPHVATTFYPELTLFRTLSERPAWWIYLMVVSLVGYVAISILAEMMRHR